MIEDALSSVVCITRGCWIGAAPPSVACVPATCLPVWIPGPDFAQQRLPVVSPPEPMPVPVSPPVPPPKAPLGVLPAPPEPPPPPPVVSLGVSVEPPPP